MSLLQVLELSQTALSGSSSGEFSRWKKLQVLSVFENVALRWDLNLLHEWPALQHTMMKVHSYGVSLLHLQSHVEHLVPGLQHRGPLAAYKGVDATENADSGIVAPNSATTQLSMNTGRQPSKRHTQ